MTSETSMQDFVREGLRIVQEAESCEIPLRLVGALAVNQHSHGLHNLFGTRSRKPTDIDLITYSKYKHQLKDFMIKIGYEPDLRIIAMFGNTRQIFYDKNGKWHVDVFIDKLDFCHTVDLVDRLEIDSPTIPLADLTLEKMQILQINEKDLQDTALMFREHNVGESDKEEVNGKYIARKLGQDWGFYYTVITNLKTLEEYVSNSDISHEDKSIVRQKIDKLSSMIENEPKSARWKMRAKIGTRKKWYNDVGDIVR